MFALLYLFPRRSVIHQSSLSSDNKDLSLIKSRVQGNKEKEFIVLADPSLFWSDARRNLGMIPSSVISNLFTARPLNLISYWGNAISTEQQRSFTRRLACLCRGRRRWQQHAVWVRRFVMASLKDFFFLFFSRSIVSN